MYTSKTLVDLETNSDLCYDRLRGKRRSDSLSRPERVCNGNRTADVRTSNCPAGNEGHRRGTAPLGLVA